MMKRKPVWALLAFGVLSLGVTRGAFAVMSTMETYSNACSTLDGFPGLLQSAGFVPTGKCRKEGEGEKAKCRDDGLCRVDGRVGHCEPRLHRHEVYCACVFRKTSH